MALMPLLIMFFSCEMPETDEYLIKYNEAPPATLVIEDMPYSGILYIQFDDSGKSVQGNAPVGADGRAILNLHLPTGIPYKVVNLVKTTLFILQDNKTDVPLYKTAREITIETHAVTITLSFTAFAALSE
jgi:hypothetical protein